MSTTITLIGNAHLDPAWLWQWQEGFAEIKATFRSALDRMQEFDNYVFTAAGASYYQWIEENEPAMFAEIKERVAEGRWVIAGGWWLQPDCNLPSGESFARHGLYGQRYFYSRFGKIASFGYNVDSFGHNGALPQLLRLSGMQSYVMMRPENHEKLLEQDSFWWEGIDGSRVLTYRIPCGYGTAADNHDLERKYRLIKNRAVTDQEPKMLFYGVGNHGGGPTIAALQLLEELQKSDDKLLFGSPADFFQEWKQMPLTAVVTGDLQHHAIGCYSAYSAVKQDNRRSESRLVAAEKAMTIASRIAEMPYQGEEIKRGWESVLFNQFHDILGGCSLKSVYEDAREGYGEALKISANLLNHSLQRISWRVNTSKGSPAKVDRNFNWNSWETETGGSPMVVFNLNPWETTAYLPLTRDITGAVDEGDTLLPFQRIRADKTCNHGKDDHISVLKLTLPPMGYRTVFLSQHRQLENPVSERMLKATCVLLENDWFRLSFQPTTGSLDGLFDKEQNVNLLKSAAVGEVLEDFQNDTWAHNQNYLGSVIGSFSDASLELIERGSLFTTLRATSVYKNSTLVQDFTVYRDTPEIKVAVRLNWQEPFKVLKLAFPVAVQNPQATYEIPYGCIQKDTNGMEEAGQSWFDISGTAENGEPAGISIVTSNGSSYSVEGSIGRFVAVRSAGYADHYGIKDRFTEVMDLGLHSFTYHILPHAGALDQSVPTKKARELQEAPVCVYETFHPGSLPLKNSFACSSAKNVLISVIKQVEDGTDTLIRAFETNGLETEAELSLSFLNRSCTVHFAPHEIKTIRFAQDGSVSFPNLCELPEECLNNQ